MTKLVDTRPGWFDCCWHQTGWPWQLVPVDGRFALGCAAEVRAISARSGLAVTLGQYIRNDSILERGGSAPTVSKDRDNINRNCVSMGVGVSDTRGVGVLAKNPGIVGAKDPANQV